jgi:hypothetical protein
MISELSLADRIRRWLPALLMLGLITGNVAWVQATTGRKTVAFDEIDVQRINVREPDGTLRMVISNTSAAPGVMVKGKEYRHPTRNEAGIIFMNDEGTENGGLIFGGSRKAGKVSGGGHLSFDQYEQDQVISLDQGEDDGVRHATLTFNDMPDTPIPWNLLERYQTAAAQAELKKLQESGGLGVQRVVLGKTVERNSVLELKDAKGRPRLVLKVVPDGGATIEFLDESGKVVRRVTPDG